MKFGDLFVKKRSEEVIVRREEGWRKPCYA